MLNKRLAEIYFAFSVLNGVKLQVIVTRSCKFNKGQLRYARNFNFHISFLFEGSRGHFATDKNSLFKLSPKLDPKVG